jgi:hypothetical protein
MTQTGTILYHTAGSGGDIIGTAWTMNPNVISAVRYLETNSDGRAVMIWDHSVLEQFPRTPRRHWYSRNWAEDLDRLLNLDQPWFFNVCDIEQARLIRSHLQDRVKLVGVTYSEQHWPFVLDGFCRKVLDADDYLTRDDVGENFLDVAAKTPEQRAWFVELGQNKQLGAWYHEQALSGGVQFPPRCCSYDFDESIDLSELLDPERFRSRITSLVDIADSDQYFKIYDHWLAQQNKYCS